MLMVAFKNGFEKGGRSMNEMTFKRNELLAQQVIKGLVSRNMSGYYAASREEALKLALSLIPDGSTVTMGGAMSAHEIGRDYRRWRDDQY